MSQPGTLAAALAFVPNWWQDTADPFALDSLLTELVAGLWLARLWARPFG